MIRIVERLIANNWNPQTFSEMLEEWHEKKNPDTLSVELREYLGLNELQMGYYLTHDDADMANLLHKKYLRGDYNDV